MTNKEKKQLHTDTISKHCFIVRDVCNHMHIPELGAKHDESKWSKEEFEIYKWADGKRSPHDNARDELGYSPSWVYHKAKNLHHWEPWCDYNSATSNGDGTFTIICRPVKMPYKYVIEMFCDFVGAGKAYNKGDWTTRTPIDYWYANCEGQRAMHPYSEALLVKLLEKLSQYDNIEDFYKWYQKNMDMLEKIYNTEV